MRYTFSKEVRTNDTLRESFNALTQKTFYFNFEGWYAAGHWGDLYVPHVLCDKDKVISNVSVNWMVFDVEGKKKTYLQLGTVMTDEAYRNQGLNRDIMEHIIKEYAPKVDGIYLFGNDSVLDYYPKFGFCKSKEYEYYMPHDATKHVDTYALEPVDMSNTAQCERLYKKIKSDSQKQNEKNQNDAFCMSENIGLFQFWLTAEYTEQVFYLPELDVYVVASIQNDTLYVYQIFGKQQVDISRLAGSFEAPVKEIILGYTPVDKKSFQVRERNEEDTTLFILGSDLQCIEQEKMSFPTLSHA